MTNYFSTARQAGHRTQTPYLSVSLPSGCVNVTAYCTVVIYSEVREADRREPGNKRTVVDIVAGKEDSAASWPA